MANDILGSELNIDGLIEAADKAQKAMDKVADSAEGAGKRISDVFKSISTQGIDNTLQKLYDLKATYESISKVKVKDAGLKEIATNAKTALDEVNKLIEGLSKAYGAKTPTSTTAQQESEENRYNEWLRKKHEEEQIHKQIEDRKTQATRSAIAEQNQAYAEAKAKKQSISRDNDNVKTNAEAARKAYEEQLRIYENLFAQSEKKRPDLIDVAKTRTDINAVDSQLDKLMDRINRLNNEMQLFKSMESGQTLHTEDYAYIGQVADELKKLIAEYEALYNKRGQLQQQLKTYKTEEEQLAQAQANQRKNQEKNTTFEGAKEFSEKATNINRQKKAIEYLTQARAKLNLTTYEGRKKAQELTDAIAQHEKELKRATQSTEEYHTAQRKLASKRLEHIYSVSPNLALNYSQQAKSINEQVLAIKRLKSARDNLNSGSFTSEEAYRKKVQELTNEIKRLQTEVDKLRGKQEWLGQSHHSLMNTTVQLTRKLALLFSVSAIQGYIQKLAGVRAEFELQQRSLQAILQNKENADELWGQTTQLALKSPFRVKELVSYTKQLAAYRIETDKLHDTTKRLADVSAGLGVDMQRLILAYGQVRAAEYLRATELRQFTEAGIPMLDELAKYFTEMEGRTVTTAEVFERISKRMVEFGDIEEVFNRITSAGGVFYEMQEKQADTLHGQISNLHDAIDLMLNDIGAANDGTMKGLVATARAVVDNWEEVWVRMQSVLLALAAFEAKSLFVKFLATETGKAAAAAYSSTAAYSSWGAALQGMGAKISSLPLRLKSFFVQIRAGGAPVLATATNVKSLGNILSGALLRGLNVARAGFAALKVAMSSFLPMLAITALVELYFQLTEASREAERLKEALSGVDEELGKDLEKSISTYERLARVISDGTKSYTERDEAMQDLKRAFSDVLPLMYLERDTIIEMAGKYTEVTNALRLYYSEKARLQKTEKLDEHYQNKFATDIKESWNINTINAGGWGIQENEYLKVLNSVVEKAKDAAKDGGLWDKDKLRQELADALQLYYAFSDETKKRLELNLNLGNIDHNLGDIIDNLREYQRDAAAIGGLPAATKAEESQIKFMGKMRKEYDEYKKTLAEINSLYGKYANLQKKSRQTGEKINDQDVKAIENELREKYKKIDVAIPVDADFSSVADNAFAMEEEIDRVGTTMRTNFVNNMAGMGESIAATAESVYMLNTSFAWLSNAPMPEALSGIKILSPELKSVAGDFGNIKYQLQTLDGTPVPPFFEYLPTVLADAEQASSAIKKMAEDVTKESDKLVDTPYQNFINNIVKAVADEQNIALNMIDFLQVEADATTASVSQAWENIYDDLIAKRAMAQKIMLNNPLMDVVEVFQLVGAPSQIESMEELDKIIATVKKSADRAGFDWDKKKSRSKKKGEDPAKDFANMLKEIHDSYEDLNDWMGGGKAVLRTKGNWQETFEKAAKGVKGFKLAWSDFDFTNINGLISALEQLKEAAKTDKVKGEIDKMIGELATKRDKGSAKESADARNRGIDQLFEMYDLYKEIDKLGFSKNEAKSLFGINVTSLKELSKQLKANKHRFEGKEGEKEYKKYLDKFTKLEGKEQAERLKTYKKYLEIGMNERVKVKMEELRQLQEVEDMKQYTPKEKGQIRKAIRKETQEKLDKTAWEEFTQSDMYIQIFQDLDDTSDAVIKAMLGRLKSLKGSLKDLDPSKVKELTEQMDKLQDELESRTNPVEKITSNLGTYIKYLKTRNSLEEKYQQSQDEIVVLEAIKNSIADRVAILEKQYAEAVKTYGVNSDQASIAKVLLEDTKALLQQTLNRLAAERKISQELADQIAKGKKAGNQVSDGLTVAANRTTEAWSAFESITDSIQSIFGDFDENTQDVLENIGVIVDGVATTEQGLANIIKGEIFTGTLQMMSGIGKTMAGIFGNKDKKKERQIQKEVELVEELEKSYENLEKAIDKAYSLDTYQEASETAENNLKSQIESYKKMIQLEEDKKNTDEDRITEWEEAMDDLNEQLDELYGQRFSDVTGGILDDTRSAAREFVDAWLDAYLEMGEGMESLEESFKDMLKNMLKQQASMIVANTYLENWKSELEKYVNEDDLELTKDEAKRWVDSVAKDIPALNDSLTAYFDALKEAGIDLASIDGSGLSGLQEGVQGVTEETAQIIEAYLNSIRFYIAQDNQNLADLRNFFIGSDEDANPILSQLKMQTELIRAIKDMFSSVIYSGGHPTYGGAFLKVSL